MLDPLWQNGGVRPRESMPAAVLRNSNGFFTPPFCMAARYGSRDGIAGCGRKAYIQKGMGKQYGKSGAYGRYGRK